MQENFLLFRNNSLLLWRIFCWCFLKETFHIFFDMFHSFFYTFVDLAHSLKR